MSLAPLPRLYAILDVDVARRAGWAARDLAVAYLEAGARLLQLRAKSVSTGALLELATVVAEEAAATGARLIVNDRADVALLARAHGVHVGQDDLPPTEVRRIVGADLVVGLSTHTAEQVDRALSEPLSYVAVGPVFSTGTKDTGYDAVGLALVRYAARGAHSRGLPVVAIGGITLERAAEVLAAGATTLAVITDLLSPDPGGRVREWMNVLS